MLDTLAHLGLLRFGVLQRQESIPRDVDSVDDKEAILQGNKL